jgi:alpha-galactosidase
VPAFRDVVALPRPDELSVYEHGWQSWSPAGLYAATAATPRPAKQIWQTMAFRPERPAPHTGAQGEGLLAVREPSGRTTVVSAPDPATDVASIRTRVEGDRLVVSADGPVEVRVDDRGLLPALEHWADDAADRAGGPPLRSLPAGWCSWYYYWNGVTEADVLANLAALDELGLEVGVVQVDDGHQSGIGDWLTRSPSFGRLADLAGAVTATGRRAGIWTAPFLVGADSDLARAHPDWLVRGAVAAEHHWDQQIGVLDVTHPGAREHLSEVYSTLAAEGFSYHKVDFLYAGAMVGGRHEDASPLAAYRLGVQVVREAIGDDAVLVGCGRPCSPSIGLVDRIRAAALDVDPARVAAEGDRRPARHAQRARERTGPVRAVGRLGVNDPDCLPRPAQVADRTAWAEQRARPPGGPAVAATRCRDLDEPGWSCLRGGSCDPPTPAPRPGTRRRTRPGRRRPLAARGMRLGAAGTPSSGRRPLAHRCRDDARRRPGARAHRRVRLGEVRAGPRALGLGLARPGRRAAARRGARGGARARRPRPRRCGWRRSGRRCSPPAPTADGARRARAATPARRRPPTARSRRASSRRWPAATGTADAVTTWQVDNEPGNHDSTRCWCDECAQAFRGWLRDRYGSVDALNAAWGTVFWSQVWPSFEAVELPRATVTATTLARARAPPLRQRPGDERAARAGGAADPAVPGAAAAHQPLPRRRRARLPRGRPSDRPGRPRQLPARRDRAVRRGLPHDLCRGLADGAAPWVVEQQPGPVNWTPTNPPVPPGQVRLWGWQAALHGVDTLLFFRWRRCPLRPGAVPRGLLRHDATPDRGLAEAVRLGQELRDADPGLLRRPAARVALTYAYDDAWALEIDPHAAGLTHRALVLPAQEAAARCGQDVDVVDPVADLTGYDVVLAPALHLCTPRAAWRP